MVDWIRKAFDDLTPRELYDMLQLRSEVFVVEQQCIFPDMDGKDPLCHHILGHEQGRLLAYARLVPPGVSFTEPSIGRVVTAPQARGRGLGRELMQQALIQCRDLYGQAAIRIGAQAHLENFYASFGFRPSSGIYLEDGIQHLEMVIS